MNSRNPPELFEFKEKNNLTLRKEMTKNGQVYLLRDQGNDQNYENGFVIHRVIFFNFKSAEQFDKTDIIHIKHLSFIPILCWHKKLLEQCSQWTFVKVKYGEVNQYLEKQRFECPWKTN